MLSKVTNTLTPKLYWSKLALQQGSKEETILTRLWGSSIKAKTRQWTAPNLYGGERIDPLWGWRTTHGLFTFWIKADKQEVTV